MKTILIIFLLSFSLSLSQTGWVKINSPTDKRIIISDFFDVDFGIIVSQDGYYTNNVIYYFYYTLDGGITFNDLTKNYKSSEKFFSAKILNKYSILVSGVELKQNENYLNFIKKTTDLGNTWEIIYEELSQYNLGYSNLKTCGDRIYFSSKVNKNSEIYFVDGNVIGISKYFDCEGEYWGFYEYFTDYTCGGQTNCKFNYYHNENYLRNFSFPNFKVSLGFLFFKNFWLANNESNIFKSWDKGSNWEIVSNLGLRNGYLNGGNIFKQDTGFFYYSSGEIYKSNDCINLLKCKAPSEYLKIYHIFSVNKNIAYAVGDSGLILKTIDGGGVYIDDVEEENINESSLEVYPNISSSFINLKLNYNPINAKTELINTLGVTLFSQNINSTISTLSIENLPQGLYFLKYTDKQNIFYRKVVKE